MILGLSLRIALALPWGLSGYMDQELVHYIYIWVQVDGFMIGKIFNISHIYVQTEQHYRIYFLLAG